MKPLIHANKTWLARARLSPYVAVALAVCLHPATIASAHDPGLSVATARVTDGKLSLRLAFARSDVERLLAFDANQAGQVTNAESQAALTQLQEQARAAFEIRSGGRVLGVTKVAATRDNRDGVQFDLTYPAASEAELSIRSTWFDRLPRGHRQFLSVLDAGNISLAQAMLDAAHNSLAVRLAAGAEPAAAPHGFRDFLALGVEHIATGYDHLLFLFGLLLVGGSLRSALKIITSFTVAHSITLALATLNLINLPPRIIEPLIAASIVFVGAQNLLTRNMDERWLLTFGFGLIHGCGFASALRDLGIGANGGGIVVPLLSFNLGVELGQLAVAALVLPCIWWCHKSPVFVRRLVPVGSALIVLAGGYWFMERTVL